MDFQKKVFTSEDLGITYYKGGNGKPILFLHGAGVRALTYKKFLSLLENKYAIIAPDLPGYGESDLPKSTWNFRDYAHVMNELLIHEGITDVVIIGHSFGGRIALVLSTIHKATRNIVMLNSAGTVPHETKLQLAYRFFFAKNSRSHFDLNYFLTLIEISKDFIHNVIKNLLHLPHVFDIVFNSLYTPYPEIQKLTNPVLMIKATDDRLVQSNEVEELKRILPQLEVKTIEGDHDLILSKPDLILNHISHYLD